MSGIRVHDKNFVPFITKESISSRIQELGWEIDKAYAGKSPFLIVILNGAFIFAADLARALSISAEVSFVKLQSYRGTSSTGVVAEAIGLEASLSGRHVIIVEDIVDTGKTLFTFLPWLEAQNPASIAIASFLAKPEALCYPLKTDFVAFEIPNKFVVGYGLDYDGLGRTYPDLYILEETGT